MLSLMDDYAGVNGGLAEDGVPRPFTKLYVTVLNSELIADRVWRTRTQLELAVVKYFGWYNAARLHESLGDIPPLEYEQHHHHREPITLVGPTV